MNKRTSIIAILFFCILGIGKSYAQGSITYAVNMEQSYVHIYTGTSGLLKGLSHKHLIAIRDISGEVLLDGDNSSAQLSMYPKNFLVDADEERALAIDEAYQEPVAGWIKTGTKGNMNGRKLLEADLHPEITAVIKPNNLSETPIFSVLINLKGYEHEIKVPGNLVVHEDAILASGEFSISHSDLDLKRFSVPGGLSNVADSLRFVFEIKAQSN